MSHWRWIWILWAVYIIAKKHPWSGPSTSTQYISTLHNYLTLNLFHLRRGESRDDLCNICLSLSQPFNPFLWQPMILLLHLLSSCLVLCPSPPPSYQSLSLYAIPKLFFFSISKIGLSEYQIVQQIFKAQTK